MSRSRSQERFGGVIGLVGTESTARRPRGPQRERTASMSRISDVKPGRHTRSRRRQRRPRRRETPSSLAPLAPITHQNQPPKQIIKHDHHHAGRLPHHMRHHLNPTDCVQAARKAMGNSERSWIRRRSLEPEHYPGPGIPRDDRRLRTPPRYCCVVL